MAEQTDDAELLYTLRVRCGSCGHIQDAGMRTTSLADALKWQQQFRMAQAAQQGGDKK